MSDVHFLKRIIKIQYYNLHIMSEKEENKYEKEKSKEKELRINQNILKGKKIDYYFDL